MSIGTTKVTPLMLRNITLLEIEELSKIYGNMAGGREVGAAEVIALCVHREFTDRCKDLEFDNNHRKGESNELAYKTR